MGTDLFGQFLGQLALGFETALSLENLLFCAIGVTLGTFLGALPGIGVLVSMSLLFPITFHLEPTAAIIMLGGIYYGTTYGGSMSSILLNVPGTPANAVACLDGFPMARQGRAAVALSITTLSSFFGASVGILVIMLFAPTIAAYALEFGPAEYFSLMLLGLVAASTISPGSPIKGIAMVFVGIAIGLVGTDLNSGVHRYTFGLLELRDGISLLAVAMGLFGVTEVIASIRTVKQGDVSRESISFLAMIPTRDDMRRFWMPSIRGAAIGSFIGALPGTGGVIASFLSYATEKRVSKTPEAFGHGAIEGLIGPEAANNASDQTAFIPTLTLGIPGSPALALILGVLMIHGVSPGPSMVTERPEMFWGLIMSFWIGNAFLLILNLPFIGFWVRILTIPYYILYPAILFLVCIGLYSVNNSVFDMWMVVLFSLFGYGMRIMGLSAAPLILGLVLGPMMEIQFRRTLIFSGGDFTAFVDRPISAVFLCVTAVILGWTLLSFIRSKSKPVEQAAMGE
ncbi:MAG: tripartite tricarboxylate transporter permease [Rhizobiaceae bacterium]|nr:tripartite tricarboxylate transporter permease [Rhizobiaceae bacterium]